MYDTILIPVDLSTANVRAIRRATQLGDPGTTTIILLHVIETLQDVPFEEMEDFYEELRHKADETLSTWVAAVRDDGYDVRGEVAFGSRGREITRLAGEQDADLIVLRSHVFDERRPDTSLGTVSHQVALFAPCSVLLVREE